MHVFPKLLMCKQGQKPRRLAHLRHVLGQAHLHTQKVTKAFCCTKDSSFPERITASFLTTLFFLPQLLS